MSDILTATIYMTALSINISTMMLTLPRKKGLLFTIAVFAAFTVVLMGLLVLTESLGTTYGGIRAFAYFPVVVLLFQGPFFQKLFAFVMQFLMVMWLLHVAIGLAQIFVPYDSGNYILLYFCIVMVLYIIYFALVYIFGQRLINKLFVFERTVEWALYSLGAILSFIALVNLQSRPIGNMVLYFFMLFFILWSIIMLCFAIISTHEKTKQRLDAEFARSIVSSGRDHYQKMDGMYDKLRILRHDYKYHLSAVRKMLSSGNLKEVNQYLTYAENQMAENELPIYCSNSVLNALVAGYTERCASLDIRLDVNISIPEPLAVPDYDMCIVLGNLLENAVNACTKQESVRTAELAVKPQGSQLVIIMRNSFDGCILQNEGAPVSTKKDGGLGLRSVQAVAARYGGELITEWNDMAFTTYVYMSNSM